MAGESSFTKHFNKSLSAGFRPMCPLDPHKSKVTKMPLQQVLCCRGSNRTTIRDYDGDIEIIVVVKRIYSWNLQIHDKLDHASGLNPA